MHLLGKRGYLDQYRNGALYKRILETNAYDFNDQYFAPLDTTIKAGDSILASCIWDNTSNKTVSGGEATDQEMCLFAVL